MSSTSDEVATTVLDEGNVAALLDFADAALPTLRLANGLFCFDRELGGQPRGESVRYSMMVLLGMLRRRHGGAVPSVEPGELHDQIHAHADGLGVGDLGLLLRADARIGSDRAGSTMALLTEATTDDAALARLEGMEVAWFALGAIEAAAADLDAAVLVDRAMLQLRRRRSPRSPLYRHFGTNRGRALLPNFATQIYSLMALTEAARHGLAADAEREAVRLADALVELRLDDAGWPWLFHADQGTVIEPYEVYSVHQDAMAPMALLALSEVVHEQCYARAAVEGLRWCYGHNELEAHFYEPAQQFAHRSIRRRGWCNRTDLAVNTALGLLIRTRRRVDLGGVELNTTCRPYHLGWILEAWSARPAAREMAASASSETAR